MINSSQQENDDESILSFWIMSLTNGPSTKKSDFANGYILWPKKLLTTYEFPKNISLNINKSY